MREIDSADSEAERTEPGSTRRDVLRATAAAVGTAGIAGCSGGSGATTSQVTTTAAGPANHPVEGDSVTIGLAIPQSERFREEGADLRAGYELAAKNLNEGTGVVGTSHTSLDGGGINGKTVELAVENTESDGDAAGEAATTLVDHHGAIMVTGGASVAEANALSAVAEDREVVHMVGFVPGNSISGERCSRFAFQAMFNAKMAGQALAPELTERLGSNIPMMHVQPDTTLGDAFASSMREQMKATGSWYEVNRARTRPGRDSYESVLKRVNDAGPDVAVLNYYGLDGANILAQAKRHLDEEIAVVIPVFDRAMAGAAGGAIEDVVGTVTWDTEIGEPISRAFTQAWRNTAVSDETVAERPSGVAHLAYFQLLQYAAAVERAGSFHPEDVIGALEGHQFAVGMGTQEFRACDHQAIRPVPVVRGRSADRQSPGRFYDLLDIARDVGYGCDESPADDCEFSES